MESRSPHFGCFALQKPSTPPIIFLSDISLQGQPSRHRKVHAKSRLGCKNCKTRKVKCDEEQPCGNCVKRNQKCSFSSCPKVLSSMGGGQKLIHQPLTTPSTLPDRHLSPVNLQHMQLLHHFQFFTSETFVLDPDKWKEAVVALALQNTFLMHAVFLVVATHLQHLQPRETSYQIQALEHLSKAIPMFRHALATTIDFKGDHAEALIACSMLLLQYSWTGDSEGWGNILGLYRGLKNIVLKSLTDLALEESRLIPMLSYSPRMRIEHHFRDTAIPPDIEDIFTHCLSCTKISDTQAESPNDLLLPSQRLMTILCALRLGPRNLEASGLMLDVARYLFSWPNLLPGGFINLVKMEDWRPQIIMLYYFAAVSRLRDDRFWWMRERGVRMFEAIAFNIGERCKECMGRAIEIFNEED